MSAADRALREESVRQHCRLLRLPTVAAQFGRLADEAMKQEYGPMRYVEALQPAEVEERGAQHGGTAHSGSASAAGENAG